MFKALCFLVVSCLFSITTHASTVGCPNADVISGKLLTDVCWSCLFPIKVMGVSISGKGGRVPSGAADNPLCICSDDAGLPRPGITTSMWEPARLVEFEHVPGCSSVLNGITFPFDRLFQGTNGTGDKDGGDSSFYHFHYYAFPLLSILDLFIKRNCNADGYMDLDIMYMSELDPTWNNDELAFFANPEAAAVSNPIATAACSADAIAASTGHPISSMFWCAGSWGNIYPFSGNQAGNQGVLEDTSLLSVRVLAALHRRGLAWQTMGDRALCRGFINPVLPKAQYKFTMFYPVAETDSDHVIGQSTLVWGVGRTLPGIGEDPVYLVWRWVDCCNN